MTRLRRVGLLAAMALAAVNLFTGAPLAAIWAGARVQGEQTELTMTAVLVVIAVMAVLCWLLVVALNRLGAAHDRLSGREPGRRQTTWLQPFNTSRRQGGGAGMSALDTVLVAAVVLAGLAFEIWFFFFAGSSIGSG